MVSNIQIAIVLGTASLILCENHVFLSNGKTKDMFRYPFVRNRNGTSKKKLNSLIDAKLCNHKYIYKQDLRRFYDQSNHMPVASLQPLNMHDLDKKRLRLEPTGAKKTVSKRHDYKSCCECCRTQILMVQLSPLASNLTQIISVGACPEISRSAECGSCSCTLENRIYWILEETLDQDLPVTTPGYRFVPVEYPGHCIHANDG